MAKETKYVQIVLKTIHVALLQKGEKKLAVKRSARTSVGAEPYASTDDSPLAPGKGANLASCARCLR
jgi:hypothetical protein